MSIQKKNMFTGEKNEALVLLTFIQKSVQNLNATAHDRASVSTNVKYKRKMHNTQHHLSLLIYTVSYPP